MSFLLLECFYTNCVYLGITNVSIQSPVHITPVLRIHAAALVMCDLHIRTAALFDYLLFHLLLLWWYVGINIRGYLVRGLDCKESREVIWNEVAGRNVSLLWRKSWSRSFLVSSRNLRNGQCACQNTGDQVGESSKGLVHSPATNFKHRGSVYRICCGGKTLGICNID
ncbi:hypothetical protein CEXT_31861 [Caerostris extrusa]|uniref:Uncharacterized protein n=1 Tax=Caerostris extrusa TaxID=172846 RepID=A0AAV4SF32_CAEEX|nr:hypothetical protein CEXT_31861 [Caerostris extrusa]